MLSDDKIVDLREKFPMSYNKLILIETGYLRSLGRVLIEVICAVYDKPEYVMENLLKVTEFGILQFLTIGYFTTIIKFLTIQWSTNSSESSSQ